MTPFPESFTTDLLNEFGHSKSPEELWQAFRTALEPLGLQSAMYLQGVAFDDMNDTCLEAQSRCETLLGTLIDEEFVAAVKSDPELRKIDHYSQFWKRSIRPFAFSCDSDAHCPPAVRPLNRVMNDFGVVGGLVVPLRGFGPDKYGNASFMLAEGSAIRPDQLPVDALTAYTHYLNGYMVISLKKKVLDIGELSPRERECLQWVAAGLGTKQLSDRMGISTDTANEYLCNARRKLRAGSRSEAVARAVALQMISL